MNPDNNEKSVTRLLTVPNTSSQPVNSGSSEKKDVNERIADLESTIKRLQLELINFTSQQESSKESLKMNIKPKPKLDSTMNFDHVNLVSDHEMDTGGPMNFKYVDRLSDHEEDTGDTMNNPPNVQKLNQRPCNTNYPDDDDLNTMISDLKAELQAQLQYLKDVACVEDDEE